MGMLNVGSNDVRIMGIHGMGDIGKTTLAKVVFNQLSSRFEYCSFLADVVDIIGGLPLALETIGSFLSGKTKKVWDDTLKKLEKVPRNEVEKKLRISYDALDHWQKQIFLDIVCLFIGFDRRIVVHLWDDADFFPEEGIEVVRLMSLIKIGDDNKLWMHNQLRDLGREIVRQESNMEFGRHSRLWNHEEALQILIHNKVKRFPL
ncbi:disease resistance protein RUN1-like [Syzygium oleosum]|uniref:disease resistance protein RUN1-like n=1 Tax=Syzygium oleosum TaxID=219896 RepID=UPI0024BA1056|nr:disease resistance protein RUN1-like [Syzygium oleosum]XP_056173473.1 disease resistance protein RUN1-like [Syzygium oleosum]